jgi:hypothetical protein
MALGFANQKGSAQKSSLNTYKIKDGEQTVRIVGDILARYVYWVKGENNKDIPFECLEFNRDTETFDRAEQDYVKEYYPDIKCGWAYAVQVIADGKIAVFNLKKKLWEQIITAAEDLGDPTDPDTGWDVVFEKKKTGPRPINVEYTLKVLRCKNRALNAEERALVDGLKSMEEVMPRSTPEAQKTLLDRIRQGANGGNTDNESIDEEFSVD